MELLKSNIHMNKIIKKQIATIHVNHEDSVTEGNGEISSIINHVETVTADNVIVRNNQITINGTVSYGILFYSDENGSVNGTEGEIPFEENIKVSGLSEDNEVRVRPVVSASSVKQADSKSYICKIQITVYITVENTEDLEAVTSIARENIMIKYDDMDGLGIVSDNTDTFRIKDEVSIPGEKPAIEKILWRDVRIKSVNTKLLDGMIQIRGELYVFVMYVPEDDGMSPQWLENTISFSGTLEMSEVRENMVSYIEVDLLNFNVEAGMNQDNETRILNINALLKLNIKIYQEKQIRAIQDVYAPGANLVPVTEEKTYEKLLVKNASRTKNTIKLNIDGTRGNILQICNSGAEVKIDNIIVCDNGLKAVGKIKAHVMYVSSDDAHPICHQCKEADFEHGIDAEGISPEDKYYINWRVEQVNGNMLSSTEAEIKAVIALEAIVFREETGRFIKEIKEEPIDMEAVNAAPILKGYVVQSGDTLWKLAKENYTTVENIMKVNDLKNDRIKKGDRLLLVKSCH